MSMLTAADHAIEHIQPTECSHPPHRPDESKSILDLPAELRNYIYELLLPDTDRLFVDRALVHQVKDQTYHNLMRVNKQIYEETRSLLYTSKVGVLAIFSNEIIDQGRVFWLGKPLDIHTLDGADFAAINNFDSLEIRIICMSAVDVCDTHGVLFKAMSALAASRHRLFHLRLDVRGYRGGSLPSDDLTTNRYIEFLCDPLRLVQPNTLHSGRSEPTFKLFASFPETDLSRTALRATEKSVSLVDAKVMYTILARYWTVASRLYSLLEEVRSYFWLDYGIDSLHEVMAGLAEAYMRYDSRSVRKIHDAFVSVGEDLLKRVYRLIRNKVGPYYNHGIVSRTFIYGEDSPLNTPEPLLREAEYLLLELPRLLPPNDEQRDNLSKARIQKKRRVRGAEKADIRLPN
jgi:hypothetical protein